MDSSYIPTDCRKAYYIKKFWLNTMVRNKFLYVARENIGFSRYGAICNCIITILLLCTVFFFNLQTDSI